MGQILLFVRAQRTLAKLLNQILELIDPLLPPPLKSVQLKQPLTQRLLLIHQLEHFLAQRQQPTIPVKQIEMGAHLKDREALVLAVDIDQTAANFTQHSEADRTT